MNSHPDPSSQPASTADVIVHGDAKGFLQSVTSGTHNFEVDEPTELGGSNRAPTPYDLLLAALGSCTSMTIGLYARRKQWPLRSVTVALSHGRIHARDCADCETKEGMVERIDMEIKLDGDLTAEQSAKLMEIAGKCPVHRTLKGEIEIRKKLATPAA
jgi:putative redox protein